MIDKSLIIHSNTDTQRKIKNSHNLPKGFQFASDRFEYYTQLCIVSGGYEFYLFGFGPFGNIININEECIHINSTYSDFIVAKRK